MRTIEGLVHPHPGVGELSVGHHRSPLGVEESVDVDFKVHGRRLVVGNGLEVKQEAVELTVQVALAESDRT